MSDLIKREDAIEALYKYSFVSKDAIEKEINAIPSADRPKGEWEEMRNWRNGSFYSRCSECGCFDDERDDLTAYNYCPWCGADMRGADDERL